MLIPFSTNISKGTTAMTINYDEQTELESMNVETLLHELSLLEDDCAERDTIGILDLSYLGVSLDDM